MLPNLLKAGKHEPHRRPRLWLALTRVSLLGRSRDKTARNLYARAAFLKEAIRINTILAIQMNVFMVMLLLCIAVHAGLNLNTKHTANKMFLLLTGATIAILLLEIGSVILNSCDYLAFMTMQKLVNSLGFVLAPLIPIVATLYVGKRINQRHKVRTRKFLVLMVPFIVNGLLAVGSYYFNWIFHVTDENLYVRGPLFIVSPLTSYFYYAVHILFLFAMRRKISKEAFVIYGALVLFPAVLSGIQLYYFVYLTIWSSVAMAVVINYIFLLHSQAKMDHLTGLGNRAAYDDYLARLSLDSGPSLAVINIDLDEFKAINDTFGHQEGDKVLQIFARELEASVGELGMAIRWGGDEFIVLLHEADRQKLEACMDKLTQRINAYNRSNEKGYCVRFSYGIAIYDRSYDDVDALLRHSDKLMYEEKQKKQKYPFLYMKGSCEHD